MPGLLATKWITAKTAAKDHLALVNLNQGFESLLDKLEDKIDDASENANPSATEIASMKQAFNAYQAAGKDYIKKIIEANTKHPEGAKSWLIFHEAIYKIDQLVVEMLKKDSNMAGPWTKLSGFVDKSAFKVAAPQQPTANPQLAKQTTSDYYTEGFDRLAAKVKSAGGPVEQANMLIPGLNTCLPHSKALVDGIKPHVNAIAKLVVTFEAQIQPAALNATNAKTTLDQIKAAWKSVLSALPPQATPFVKVMLALLQKLDQQMATAKPARPSTPAPMTKPAKT